MHSVSVNASKKYTVLIENGMIARSGELIKEICGGKKACVVTDDNVDPLYADIVTASLEGSGFETSKYVIANGEASKTPETYLSVIQKLALINLTREDVVVALGGGVVGDIAGFAAATFKRGVKLVQIPTTLLSAVDSSVGGKTGVDLLQGKNLLGAFYQPDLVLCDPVTLSTLPEDVFTDGCAEVIKYAIIADADMFTALEGGIRSDLEAVISKCILIKARITEQDELDTDVRRILNFGHTIGHSVELLSGYSLSHGKCVAVGMSYMTRYAYRNGICGEENCSRILSLINSYGLPTETNYSPEDIFDAALNDKKIDGNVITLTVPEGIGSYRMIQCDPDMVSSIIKDGRPL